MQIRQAERLLPKLPPAQAATAKKCLEQNYQQLDALKRFTSETPATIRRYTVATGEQGKTYCDILEDTKCGAPENSVPGESLRDRLNDIMNDLSERERSVLQRRYGLFDGSVYTLDELSKLFSLTRERVRQIEIGALRKLQHPARSRKLRVSVQ